MDDVARSWRRLPSGTVTFLLTDVEGSSRLWEREPTLAGAAVARSREIVASAIDAHGGAQPLEQGEGDNVVAAFSKASDGLAAARDAQLALATEDWPTAHPVRVRMALHSGEAVPRSDGTYAGAVLNRCSRLRALAHGGQVVVSQATRDLVVDDLDAETSLLDLGSHRLRDLTRPERVWQLAAHGLPTEFSPLASLDSAPNNLPLQLSSFVGREDDIARSVALLAETRLLTLTGSGGCGKTRLALRVAAEASPEFADGTWWVELAPVSDDRLIAATVADAMGLRVPVGREPLRAVLDHLVTHTALVVLDNCEHVVAAAAQFAEFLLRAAPGVKMLATSREPLTIEGEVTWRVPSLAAPPASVDEPEALGQYDAVRLFIERAVQVQPNFTVTNANAPAVAEICHRLDGIPLAIELAVARIRLLSPERIAVALDDRFRLLAGGSRTALPRQQTLLASIDWSHELLETDERALLRRLGVFAGGFTFDAAEIVAGAAPLDRLTVLDVLGHLVSKSLVQVEEASMGGSERYRLLESIRQYALDRLDEAGEADATRDRHLAWTVDLAEALERKAATQETRALDELDSEHANMRVALEHATTSEQTEPLLRLIGSLGCFWAHRGYFTEARRWLALIPESGGGTPTAFLARARWAASFIAWLNYDLAGARTAAAAALSEARECGDRPTQARCLATLSLTVALTDFAASRAYALDARELAAEIRDPWSQSYAGFLLALSWVDQGRTDEAEAVLHADRDLIGPFFGAFVQGFIDLYRGDFAGAASAFETSRSVAHHVNNSVFELWTVAELVLVGFLHGDLDEVAGVGVTVGQQTQRWGFLGDVFGPGLRSASHIVDAPGETAAGLATTSEAMFLFSDIHDSGLGFLVAAMAAFEAGDVGAAEEYARRPLEMARATEEVGVAGLDAMLARVALARADVAAAEQHAHVSLAFQVQRNLRVFLADTVELLGRAAIAADSVAEGIRLIAAGDTFRRCIDQRRLPSFQREVDASLDAARIELGDAFDLAWTEGADLAIDDAVDYARRARGERKRPSSGWASLTPTELTVVRLATQGHTNPQIGERLFIGKGTVKTHLAHVYAKLGITSRAELGAAATREGEGKPTRSEGLEPQHSDP